MYSLYSGLIGYWNLDETGTSTNRLDALGTANSFNPAIPTSATDGVIGSAATFAGGIHIKQASGSVLQGGPKDYTWALWVNFPSVGAGAYGILGKMGATAGWDEYVLKYTGTGTDRLQFTVFRATDSAQTAQADNFGSISANTSKWLFVCGWYDNTGLTVNIEVNAGDANSTSLAGSAQAATTNTVTAIGAEDAAATNFMTGSVDEVGRWDRVLTKTERAWLYNRGKGRTFPFLGGYSSTNSRHGRSRRMSLTGLGNT